LVNDLLDVSRVAREQVSLEREPVELAEVVREALEQVQPFAVEKDQAVTSVLPAQPAYVLGDRKRLVQVVVNLLQNAVKFTPAGGRIDLQVDADHEHVRVKVCDDGQGMDEELLQNAFELFRQGASTSDRAKGGLGIGLALVKSLVEMHGGTVSARSDGPGKGCEFEVVLPRLRAADK
jgi:signal transduction histidine kinase